MESSKKNKKTELFKQIREGHRPSFEECVEQLGPFFPLLYELEYTEQDPEWHAEGNVAIHTSSVLQETYKLLEHEAQHLGLEDAFALILGALFHDIAKPLTTRVREIDGRERIVAPKHPSVGCSWLSYKLMGWGLSYSTIRTILGLVRYHHDPKFLVIREKPKASYMQLARLANLELLYYLELADIRGRICADQEEQLEDIELFRMMAEEYDVWKNPTPYQNWKEHIQKALPTAPSTFLEQTLGRAIRDFEAGRIYMPEEAVARSYQYQTGAPSLILCCGPSGSGKSTWIQKHLSEYTIVSLDQIRAELTGDATNQSANSRVRQIARERLKPLLQHNQKIVWDATNLRKDFRRTLIQLGLDYGAWVTLLVFHPDEATCHQQNEQRKRQVPRAILQHQLEHTEWPSDDEAHNIVFIGHRGHIEYSNFVYTQGTIP